MNYLSLTNKNLSEEHVCCAFSSKKYESGVMEKKKWIAERIEEGLVFYRLNERAKVFIEYLPAKRAWVPIQAPNYMYINCLWVSGKYQNGGHGAQLLDYCKQDAINRGMDGIVHLASKKKMPFLSDARFFEHQGFQVVDEAEPYFQLLALTWNEESEIPTFSKRRDCTEKEGIMIYYTAQCPFAVGVVTELQSVANRKGISFQTKKLTTQEEAQKSPAIWTTFSLFYNGDFITHEIWNETKLEKYLEKIEKECH
ncbi:N-acetyltransferase [Alkalihalobacterium bogoriense]|uniref:N-acetyltransferase n=1 Tax=Alkalihalobacterium bogoriense TaxID=246272 RepID=UPI00047A7254|nr:N-acetyltransferase [Alkalihalobacterium bogoriense]